MTDPPVRSEGSGPALSICIATFRRAAFIGETLASVLAQLESGVEVVVVDGASPDDTADVVGAIAIDCPALRYYREPVNSGVDADYDKAVGYARGEYCWLMTDDDLLMPGAIRRILSGVADRPDLLIVNAESRTPDFARVVDGHVLGRTGDHLYGLAEREAMFIETANFLSFIGAVVIRRDAWLSRDRTSYFGTLFIHVGVIFQEPPLERIRVIGEPLVRIRWGNAMWSARGFEIWMFKWPSLIWSFAGFSEKAKAAVCPREPWRNPRMLGLHRALGGYSATEYRAFLSSQGGWSYRALARGIAATPSRVANALASLYCLLAARSARRELYDLANGRNSTFVARGAARLLGL
jgi:abequosyltransferase